MEFPFISVITPTYNSASVIAECLEAVCSQDYPKDKLEVVMADAGSKDNTIQIIESFKDKLNIIITENPLKTGEAGKSAGIEKAKGDILAFIDSDNIMPGSDFLKKMTEPFSDPGIFGAEPLYFTYRKEDKPLTRYFASSGVNDPLCLYIGNYDRRSYITGKWTGFKLKTEDKGGYISIELDEKKIPTIGANGTFLRREALMKASYKPYMFDIDVVYSIVKTGTNKFAKVKTGIVHIYSRSLKDFARKQSRRINDFMFFAKEKQRTYPWAKFPLGGIFKFSIYCILIFPLIFQMLAGMFRKPALYWFYHIPVSYITLFIYGITFLKAKLTGKTAIKNRDNYKQ